MLMLIGIVHTHTVKYQCSMAIKYTSCVMYVQLSTYNYRVMTFHMGYSITVASSFIYYRVRVLFQLQYLKCQPYRRIHFLFLSLSAAIIGTYFRINKDAVFNFQPLSPHFFAEAWILQDNGFQVQGDMRGSRPADTAGTYPDLPLHVNIEMMQ